MTPSAAVLRALAGSDDIDYMLAIKVMIAETIKKHRSIGRLPEHKGIIVIVYEKGIDLMLVHKLHFATRPDSCLIPCRAFESHTVTEPQRV